MASNSRLAIAIHTAGMLAFAEQMPITSKMIAESVDTNPVVIRRIIGSLVKHGIVEVKMGTGGGSTLTRPPQEITLAEIYLALEEGEIFHVPGLGNSHNCPVGKLVRPVLQQVLGEAENGVLEKLRRKTLFDVMNYVREKLPADFCLKKKND
ncbi:MAG: Rrf2 family transcriptional regulator [Acidobacteria bacterium]|nr:Rrf2 family transcriptional regulator [Acidobacteriota bacterium]